MNSTLLDSADRPRTLLQTDRLSDFSRNFAELSKRARRPYSLTKIIRDLTSGRPHLDGFELETSLELLSLNRGRNVSGTLVPIEALSPWRRDLTTALPAVQTTVEPEAPINFLRDKTIYQPPSGSRSITPHSTGPELRRNR